MAKVIKLTDNSNNTLLPITDASYIQMKVGDDVRSVKDIIIENEEITALALNDLHSSKQEKLISGVTIKTINDESLIGSGDISLPEVYDVRFIATSASTSSSTWTCNHSYSDIVTAFNEGKLIIGMVGQSAGNSFIIDGINISLGPLGLNMQDAPDYCFLTAVRNYISGGDHVLFSMIYEDQLGIHGRILLTIRLDSSDNITVHAEAIGAANDITGGAANQIVYQTATNSTGFINAPSTNGSCLKWDSRSGGFIWSTDSNNKVTTASTSTSGSYPILFKYTANNDGETDSIRFDSDGTTNSYYNPVSNTMYVKYSYSTEFTENGTKLANKYLTLANSISYKPLYVTFTKSGASTTCSSTAEAIYTAYNTNKQAVYATYNGSIMPLKDVTRTGTSSRNYKWTANFQNLTYSANTTSGKIAGSIVGYNELSFANSYLSHPIGDGNDLWITGADIIYTGEDRYQTITGGSINQQIDSLDAKKEIRMKYVHKFASNGQITFNSGQFWGNRVYCCSTNDNTWAAISKITLANGCLVTTARDIYVDCPLGIGQSLPVEQGPAIKYILIFYAAGNITWSIASNYIKWENGVAPTTAAGDYCMLTIFNRIASLQKVNLS